MLFLQGHFPKFKIFLLGIDAGYSGTREPFQRIVMSQSSERLLLMEAAESSETMAHTYLCDITHQTMAHTYLCDITHQITAKFLAAALRTVNTHSKLLV